VNKANNTTCPKCGFTYDPGWYLPALAKARSFFGKDYQRVTAYLDLFRRAPGAQMNFSKRLRLLREVWKILQDEGYSYDGRKHSIDRHAALECMDMAVQALSKRHAYGLKNHNYWKSVMRSKGVEIMANRRERECREKEERLIQKGRYGEEKAPAHIPVPAFKPIDAAPDEMARIQAAGREILNLIQAGNRRPEIMARVCRKHRVDPHKIHQWVEEQEM